MFDLNAIQRINGISQLAAAKRRALAMNAPAGHPKDAEKGRLTKRPKRRILR